MKELDLGRIQGSMWYTGTVDGSAAIAELLRQEGKTPLEDDLYFCAANGNVFRAENADGGLSWVLLCNIKGNKGDAGKTPTLSINASGELIAAYD